MKNFYKFFLALIIVLEFTGIALPHNKSDRAGTKQKLNGDRLVNPLYELKVSNFQLASTSALPNTIFFDLLIYHTNPIDSGPFEFAAGQYNFNFNPAVANGGTLTYEIIPGSTQFTNPDAVPTNPEVNGSQLKLNRNINLVPGSGPIISTVLPGTRIVTMKLKTTAPTINFLQLNLSWRDSSSGDPFTEVYAFRGNEIINVTGGGTLIIDSTNFPLPIELSSFASLTNRNNVVLNWSTISEINNSGFEIERTLSGGQWNKIGFVNGRGNSLSPVTYSYSDNNLSSGAYKYRLKQIDFNGNYEYFNLENEVLIGSPDKFTLKQNYPNPFNPVTKIDFDIPVDADVSLKIYDMNGRQVNTLINEFRNSGYYSIDFDASSLPSGVYYYKLESGNYSSVKKLMLLK